MARLITAYAGKLSCKQGEYFLINPKCLDAHESNGWGGRYLVVPSNTIDGHSNKTDKTYPFPREIIVPHNDCFIEFDPGTIYVEDYLPENLMFGEVIYRAEKEIE